MKVPPEANRPVIGQTDIERILRDLQHGRRDALRGNDTGWRVATLQNAWSNLDARTARYRRINGIVWVEGIVTGGAVDTAIFTLPAGFRPANRATNEYHFPLTCNNAFGMVTVASTGAITFRIGSNVWVDLGPISFPADA